MKKNWVILNSLLLVVVALLAFQLNNKWRLYRSSHNPGRIKPSVAQHAPSVSRISALAEPANYSAIVDLHLFSLDRNNVIPPEPPPPAEAKVLAPKPILMGTMGLDGSAYALMVSSAGGDSSLYRRLKVGDELDGYALVKVFHDKVVMKAEGKEVDVRISDQPRRSQSAAATQGSAGAGSRVASLDGATASGAGTSGVARPEVPPAEAPEGTVFKGKRKRLVDSPFGQTVVWEDVK